MTENSVKKMRYPLEFLRAVARVFSEDMSFDFEKALFVFPNRRSIKFFQKYLGEEFARARGIRTLFSPDTTTISDLFLKLSGLKDIDPIEAQYILYKCYIRFYPDESFEDFLSWSGMLINDFNDIDKYLIDPEQIFTNIKDLRQLDGSFSYLSEAQLKAVRTFWRDFFPIDDDNFKKKNFKSLWEILLPLYREFNGRLDEMGAGYEGRIYRHVAESLGNGDPDIHDSVIFVGFNAPCLCEEALMKYLKSSGRGDFYWDYFGDMVADPRNRASLIIRNYAEKFPSQKDISVLCGFGPGTGNAEEKYTCVAVPSGVGQAFVTKRILEDLKKEGMENPIKTAVVLPDEKLLMPLLLSIPPDFGTVNVTMGYPLKGTSLYSFMNALYALRRDAARSPGGKSFYHASATALLDQEYVKKMEPEESSSIKARINRENKIYINPEDGIITGLKSDFLKMLFRPAGDVKAIELWQIEILRQLDGGLSGRDREFVYQYYKCVSRLANLQEKLGFRFGMKSYFRIISRITSRLTVPFRGEPLKGLQVMGELETRALDFDNIIILSVNEGTFPKERSDQSVIPYALRFAFGLPTYEFKDSVSAYHFYRSICRAKKVFLLYDARSDDMQTGEESRYIKQLKYQYKLPVRQLSAAAAVLPQTESLISISKTGEVMERLEKQFTGTGGGGFSATAVNTYISCPLKFCLEYVYGLREAEEVTENVDGSILGNIFHESMKNLYEPWEGKTVASEDLLSLVKGAEGRASLKNIVNGCVKKVLNIKKIEGKYLIAARIALKYVEDTLEYDATLAPFLYVEGEKKLCACLRVNQALSVNMKAFIDRIDLAGGIKRLVDYKLGGAANRVDVEALAKLGSVPDFFDSSKFDKYREVLQLFFYVLMTELTGLEDSVPGGNSYGRKPGIVLYRIRRIRDTGAVPVVPDDEMLAAFRDELCKLISEIFDPGVPFSGCSEKGHCIYCQFRDLCKRRES
ncbi:MAG: PD-(D/E)XK nuclease family protein [Bacteroidales bacterium]|nr:PD-(D/E)XK nuclease family protein [Bacteroidales bacterium]